MTKPVHHEQSHHPSTRHPRTAHHIKWALPTVAVGMGLLIGMSVVALSRMAPTPFTPHLLLSHAVGVNVTAKSDIYEMTVSKLESVESDPAFRPADGDDILVLTLKIKNTSHASYGFYPSIQTYIRDDQGNTFIMHPTLAMADPLPAGNIKAAQAVTGQLSYELPKSLKSFRLYVDPAWSGMVPVVFALTR